MVFPVVPRSFCLIHPSDLCMGEWNGVFAHVPDPSHPAPWVVAGSLPSWERLFCFSPSFIYLFFCVCVVVVMVLVLVVSFVLYLCKKFICCSSKISACDPRVFTEQVPCGHFLCKFLHHSSDGWSSCWCQCCFDPNCRLFLPVNFWISIRLTHLFLKSNMRWGETRSARKLIKPFCPWGHTGFYEKIMKIF